MSVSKQLGIPEHEFRVIFGRSKIDYDVKKEGLNRKKHGYSLESAVHLLERLVFPVGNSVPYIVSDAFIENSEIRHMHMSIDDDGKIILMVTTIRDDEIVRIISFRRAHEAERKDFLKITGYIEAKDF